MSQQFETFEIKVDGVLTKFKVCAPTMEQQREAMKVRNSTFADAVKSGALLKPQVENLMLERGLWSKEKEEKYLALEKQILDGREQLKKGGIKLSEARDLAIDMSTLRTQLIEIRIEESVLMNDSAEGQADNAHFNYLVAACTVYNDTEQLVFSGFDDYLNRAKTEVAFNAAQCLAALTMGVKRDMEQDLPENQFLCQYGFIDENLRLINKDGQHITRDGKLLDENDQVIEEVVETKPFLDDDGNEIFSSSVLDENLDEKIETSDDAASEE